MQTVFIDVANKTNLPTIYAKQGDVGRKFRAIITDCGVKYDTSHKRFHAGYSGASGSGQYDSINFNDAFDVYENEVIVELIPNMLQAPGDSLLCLTMIEDDGSGIGLWNIPVYTEKTPGFLSDPIGDYYPDISAVLYREQSLTLEETAQARKNIGAASVFETVAYVPQYFDPEAQAQARTNIGAASAEDIGDIESALDAIIAIQETLIGGDGI